MKFRISVESIVYKTFDSKVYVLLVKRSSQSKVAPGVWNVPSGKVNLLETTQEAVIRETFEETKLNVSVIKLISERAYEIKAINENRHTFTYLVHPLNPYDNVQLNHEHSEFQWIAKEELTLEKFSSMMPHLKKMILEGFDAYATHIS